MFIGISNVISGIRTAGLSYIKDNLKLYLDFKSNRSDTLAFVSEGSTSFDGNDEIKIADSNDLQLSTLTISAWIKPNGASEDGYIFSKFDDSTSGGYALNFQGSTDKIRLLSSGVTIGTSNAVFVDDNVWVHIAVTVDGSGNLVYYRNGVSAGTASSVTLNTNSVGVVIGNRTGGSSAGHYFNGSMANVAVWSRHLSPEEIQSVMNKSYSQLGSVEKTSLVSWWALDSASNGVVQPATGEVLGNELIPDGEFTDESLWDAGSDTAIGTGISFVNGQAIWSTSGVVELKQDITINSGKLYKVVLDIDSRTDGTIRNNVGSYGGTFNTAGIKTEYITGTGSRFYLVGFSGFDGALNSVSVKEVLSNTGVVTGATTTTSVYGGNSPVLNRAIDIAESFAEQIGDGSASLSANGENITISSSSVFPSGSNNKSFTAWLYKENSNNEGIFNTGSAGVRQLFAIVTYSGDIRINTYGDDITFSNSNIPINEWFHLAVVQSGRDVSVYLNGILNETKTHTGDSNLASTDLLIGDYVDNVYASWTGNIAQVGYWQGTLTQSQIQSVMESTSYAKIPADIKTNIKGYWALDADNSVPALDFNGSGDKVTISDDSSLDITGSWTCSAWIKVGSGTSGFDRIMGKQHTNSMCNYGIGLEQGIEFGAFLNNGSGNGFSAVYDSDDLVVGQWHYVTGVWDTQKLYAYVDGQLKATSADLSSTNSAVANDGALLIGVNQTNGAEYFKGSIKSCAVYSDAKDADFILAQYNKGIDADWSSDTNLSGYWKMDNGTTVNDLSSNSNNGTVSGATLIQNAVALDSTSNNNDGSLN